MRTTVTFVVAWLSALTAFAQTVDFNNFRTFQTVADRKVYDYPFATQPLVGTHHVAQLYYGATAVSLAPVTSNPARFRNVPVTDPFAGTWSGGTRTLTGFSLGDVVTLQVRVWDSTGGLTFDQAQAAGIFWGLSSTFTYRIPSAGNPAPGEFYIENFRSFALIPEPSVVALGVIGAAALLMIRGRKAGTAR
jgi:hypothetical protein